MKKQNQTYARIGCCLLAAFALWTAAVCCVDVQPIGPLESAVGFAALNRWIHRLTGVHLSLYTLTDWLSLIPLAAAGGFACLGLVQWIRRKQLARVDRSILILGGFYVLVVAAYLFFELVTVNYRPVLINGILEGSYPSSTTMLVLCIMPTAVMECRSRIKHKPLKTCLTITAMLFTVFMVCLRLLSGVHWFSDIIGGCLLSAGLVMLYRAFL